MAKLRVVETNLRTQLKLAPTWILVSINTQLQLDVSDAPTWICGFD